jgi:hypothetical protein
VAAVVVALAACSRPATEDAFTLRIGVVGALAPLAHDTNTSATTFAQDLVFEPVLRPEGSGFGSRVLARWERPSASRLRALVAEGLRFSDGSPVSPEDVVRAVSSVGLSARADGRWIDVESAPGGVPVEAGLLLATVFKRTAAGEIGTGAYRLVRQGAQGIVVERVTPQRGRIARVELVAFPTAREVFARALKREVNALTLDERQVELADGVPGLRIVRTRGPHALGVYLNPRRLDARARREIADALPIEAIEDMVQAKGCGPPSGRWHAAALPRGRPLDVTVVAVESTTERAGLAIRRALGARGGNIIRVRPDESWLARERFVLAVDNAVVWPPIVGALYWKTNAPWNATGYSNPRYDAAVDAGDFDRAEAELQQDPPVMYLCRRERIAAVDARLRNATLGSWGFFDTLPDWELSP